MHIPEVVKIGGHMIEVIDGHVFEPEEELLGNCSFDNGEILLAHYVNGKPISQDQLNLVFLHEILHMVFDMVGLQMAERRVEATAQGLYQVLKDNRLKFFEDDEGEG